MHIDTDAEIFRTESGFEALGLRKEILTAIGKLGFVHPTHIQSELVPLGVAGRDVLGQSRTGTGKTAAFGLPLLHRLAENPSPFSGLVLCPTRELAIQIAKDL
ncbi:MAG: DEAD/DEAH box helicase, partial [Planctomycetota bacterium]|nr:DEAD/DEAH box helicase [Planctomycetota bacterium]